MLPAIRGRLGEGPLQSCVKCRGEAGSVCGDGARRFYLMLAQHALRGRPLERWHTRHHLVHNASQRVHVDPAVQVAIARRLLGAHVMQRADRNARLGQRRPRSGRRNRARHAEVRDHGVTLIEEDVLRLHVPMDDVVPVRVFERVPYFPRDAHDFVQRELLLAIDAGAQRLARDIGHDEVEKSGRLAGRKQRENVRMGELRDDRDFPQEALG